jgi:hypothetical protein
MSPAIRVFLLVASFLGASLRAATIPDDPAGTALLQAAQSAIAKYDAGQTSTSGVLRVVYFHPRDRDPLPDYAARVDRIVNDVNAFYRDGLKRFGVETAGMPLERTNGRLAIHVVRGKGVASDYHHDSGSKTAGEIRAALKSIMDLDREHVLVFYALCHQEADGRYVFDAPYYGSGTAAGGLGHAADGELLDPARLRETNRNIVYKEHNYERMEQTVAAFNSMYLGGTAHELGHGLGLPHDAGNDAEATFGTSLMGHGNLTYRQEMWGGGKPVFLARATALQLLSHPLITGSNRGRYEPTGGEFETLNFSMTNNSLHIRGKASGKIPPYAAVAYVWPASAKSDHGAKTYPVVLDNGEFTISLSQRRGGNYNLELTLLHVNGGTFTKQFRFTCNSVGVPDVASLNGEWLVQRAETAVTQRQPEARAMLTAELPSSYGKEIHGKLQVLRDILEPPTPFDLATVKGDQAYLSDAAWLDAKVGWGRVARNHYWFDAQVQNGVFLTLDGQFYEKGLYAHSSSRYVFDAGGKWKTFKTTVGIRDGAHQQGSAIFVVRGDGRELCRSRLLRVGEKQDLDAKISGIKKLELIADGGEGYNHNSWAIWVDPVVRR